MVQKKNKMFVNKLHSSFSYNKYIILSFISILQKKGMKEYCEANIKNLLSTLKKTTNRNPLFILVTAFKNAKPFCEVKTIKISGINYKIPTEISVKRQRFLVLKWIINNAYSKTKNTLKNSLVKEIIDTYNLSSKTTKFCDDFHKIAESNKIFIQIRH